MTIGRRIRAVFGIAATWGVAFAAVALGALATGFLFGGLPSQLEHPGIIAAIGVRGFVTGAVAGTIFATLFARAERKNTLATLSTSRVALWGFIGGAAVPAAFTIGLGVSGLVPIGVLATGCLVYGVLGGSISAAMVTIARKAPEIASESSH